MSSNIDKRLAILVAIEQLTPDDREALFNDLYEAYQWVPEPSHIIGEYFDDPRFDWEGYKKYDLILTQEGSNRLAVLKVIRDNCGLGPTESKALLDSRPAVVKGGLGLDDIMALQERFLACGAQVEFCESSLTQNRLSELRKGDS